MKSLFSSRLVAAGGLLAGAGLGLALALGSTFAAADSAATVTLINNGTDAVDGNVTATTSGTSLQLVISLQGEQSMAGYAVSICSPDPLSGAVDNCVTPSVGANITTNATGTATDTVTVDNAANVLVVTVTNVSNPADSSTAVVVNPAPLAPSEPFPMF
ncbi:MAG: hypothetical protein ACYDCQ_15850 [Dehalococcoidia bacterium]